MKRAPWIAAVGLGLALLMRPALAGPVDPQALPPELRESYELFRARCSKCHTLDKPNNVHLTAEQWKRYVGKMMRRPGSGINEGHGAKIVEFLIYKDTHDVSAPAVAASADAGL